MNFDDFTTELIPLKEGYINVKKGGQGYPLLLLHGYPQNNFMWHKIAPLLAQNFTVIATDLRGYGNSFKPKGNVDHSNYSKRIMANDQVEIMSKLGYENFYLIGHDRGARVAHRLCLDYPDKIKKVALLDIIPTYYLYSNTDKEFANSYYHWFFLIQPFPFPETLISSNSEFFLENCLQFWSKNYNAFPNNILEKYKHSFDYNTIHGSCEDYRASFSIDLQHDQEDLIKKIECPTLILWGEKGIFGKKYDVLKIWKERANNVNGQSLNCGHFLVEECPEDTYLLLSKFMMI